MNADDLKFWLIALAVAIMIGVLGSHQSPSHSGPSQCYRTDPFAMECD